MYFKLFLFVLRISQESSFTPFTMSHENVQEEKKSFTLHRIWVAQFLLFIIKVECFTILQETEIWLKPK